jgi:hypothetical protein
VQQTLVLDVPLFAIAINGMVSAVDPSVSAALHVDETAMY